MTATLAVVILLSYFLLLILVGFLTTRRGNSETFFTANRDAPWYLVAFGMVGTTISGVTFISIPGEVGNSQWTYLPLVLGNCLGYVVIALVLLPLFYRLRLVSIYAWLEGRFGRRARLTGSFFFIVSQLIGASFRLFLVVSVLQLAFFDAAGIPFAATVLITIVFVWIYTVRGGIKTIIWTDTLQTFFILLSAALTVVVVLKGLDMTVPEVARAVGESEYSRAFVGDWHSPRHWLKQLVAGLCITVAINGLDQNMMQKNLTCRTLRESRTNMYTFTGCFLLTNLLFLALGALLYLYAEGKGIAVPARTDELFPMLALDYLGTATAVAFLLGITAAAYSSVDSSLTSLTTAFCIDFLRVDPKDAAQRPRRVAVHVGFSLLMVLVIVLFRELNDDSVINTLFTAVGYTYGPLLGLFAFGLVSRREVRGRWVLPVCLLSPVLSFLVNCYSEELLFGYRFGFEILLLNAAFCVLGLWMASRPAVSPARN